MNEIKQSIELRQTVVFMYNEYSCQWKFSGGLDYIDIEIPLICSYKGVAKNKQVSACGVVSVNQSHRNQQHATNLLRILELLCKEFSYTKITMFPSNEQMIHILKKLNYTNDTVYYVKHLE